MVPQVGAVNRFSTDPYDADTDGDRVSDGEEVGVSGRDLGARLDDI